jgi:protein-arginine kinase activator protein McsA
VKIKNKPILNQKKNSLSKKIDYSKLSIIQLEKAISVAVKNEDYELAAHLRDEINKRK